MQVIPGINCKDFKCVKEKLSIVKSQLLDVSWVHIDISDGKFAPIKTWNNPEELKNSQLTTHNSQLNIEVHLMVEKPEEIAHEWLRVGAKRIIIHLESIDANPSPLNKGEGRMNANDTNNTNRLTKILENCSGYDTEVMLALNPETPVEEIFPYLELLFFVQFLAVKPGPSGQEFNEEIIEKIKVLRERAPDITIEIDGGINPETAKLVKVAGADIIISTSYIFDSRDQKFAFETLKKI